MAKEFCYRLGTPNNYSLEKTILSHGWVYLEPFSYDHNTKELNLVLEEDAVCMSLSIRQEQALVFVESTGELRNQSLSKIRRLLALDESTFPLLKKAQKLSNIAYSLSCAGFGRLLKSPTLWEDLAKTLMTTNCNWRKTQNMVHNLCDKFGTKLDGQKSFPGPAKIVQASAKHLQECGLGYRDKYLVALAEMCLDGKFNDCENDEMATSERVEILNSVKGFGPYSVSHALIMMKDYSRIPIDSDSAAYLESIGFKNKRMDSAYESWGEYRFWGYKLGRIARKLNWIGD